MAFTVHVKVITVGRKYWDGCSGEVTLVEFFIGGNLPPHNLFAGSLAFASVYILDFEIFRYSNVVLIDPFRRLISGRRPVARSCQVRIRVFRLIGVPRHIDDDKAPARLLLRHSRLPVDRESVLDPFDDDFLLVGIVIDVIAQYAAAMKSCSNDALMDLFVSNLGIAVRLDVPEDSLHNVGSLNVRTISDWTHSDAWRLLSILVANKAYRLLQLIHDEAGTSILLADRRDRQRPLIAYREVEIIETLLAPFIVRFGSELKTFERCRDDRIGFFVNLGQSHCRRAILLALSLKVYSTNI